MEKILTLFIFSLLFFTSCATTTFDQFYTPWHENGYFPKEAYLNDEKEIRVIKAKNTDEKFREVASHWFWCIGSSKFNNSPSIDDEDTRTALKKLSQKHKATIAIWSKIPSNSFDSYTTSLPTSLLTFSETHSISRYNYSAYLFIPIPPQNRLAYTPGIYVSELTQHDREFYKQNTGVLINIVFKDTEAYYANLIHGDIITSINGKRIYTTEDYHDIIQKSKPEDTWNITFIRNGYEKHVEILFKL